MNLNLIKNLIFPPKCANCGAFIDIKLNEKPIYPLCNACRLHYENEKQRECAICGLPMKFCSCMPKNMSKANCLCLLKLISYRAEGENMPIRKFIYSIKHRNNQLSFDFLAQEMRALLINEMRAREIEVGDCIITYLPRSHKNKVKDGFDQSLALAKSLAKCTGIEFRPLFHRSLFSNEQKKLSGYQRRLNMKLAYRLKSRKIDLKNKTVILVDDIVTTGSGMGACSKLAYSAGAYATIGIAVGYTEKKSKK